MPSHSQQWKTLSLLCKMVEAKVLKKIPGYGYFPGDEGSFKKETAEVLAKRGFVMIMVKAEKQNKK